MTEDNGKPEIERSDGGSGGAYRLRVDGSLAEMTFSRAGERMIIIDHTEVPQALRGRGVGELLVARAVEDAREQGKKIVPLCPFAAAQFRKHPEYADVLSR
jgi:predicted GNAT family acetyltransferase